MASLIRHRSGRFYIVTCIKGKRVWRSLKTRDRGEAYRKFLEYQPPNSVQSHLTLLEAQQEFLSYVKTNFSQGTLEVYQNLFKHLNQFLGQKVVEDITPRDIELYKSDRLSRVSAHTVNQEIRGMRAFFNRLKTWKVIRENPANGIKQIRIPDTVRPYLSKDDLKMLLQSTNGTQIHDIILFSAMTGMRRGEVLNLKWEDVDLARGTILVRSSLNFSTKGGRIRLLPMNTTVRALLQQSPHRCEYVFPGERGEKNNGDFISKLFKRAVKACGLNNKLHFHSLRHTFASLLVKEGVSLYHVQKLLGHSSPRITEMYAHLGGVELLSSVERLAFLSQAARPRAC